LRARLDRIHKEQRDKQQELITVEKRLRNNREQFVKYQNKKKDFEKLSSDLREYRSEISSLKATLQDVQDRQKDLPSDIQKLKSRLNGIDSESNIKEKKLDEEIIFYRQSLESLMIYQREIKRFESTQSKSQLDQAREKLVGIDYNIATYQADLKNLTGELDFLSKQNVQVENMVRVINDNIRYRKLNTDIKKLDQDIAGLKQQQESFDKISIIERYKTLSNLEQELLSEKSRLLGQIYEIKEQITRIERQLHGDYRDIDQSYLESLYKVQVYYFFKKSNIMSSSDLDIFASSLEKAIMTFHAEKMKEINKIIHELWVRTYKGNDIDSIEIKTEPEQGNRKSFRIYN
jgi:DNA repair protein RAD50